MCKLLVILNQQPQDKETNQKLNCLLRANQAKLISQPDGYSVLRDDKVSYHWQSENYQAQTFQENIKYHDSQVQIIHTRQATSGEKGKNGLHLQKLNGFYFAHNGTTALRPTDKNDSYYFCDELLQGRQTFRHCKKLIKRHSFYGAAALYSPRLSLLYLFNNGIPFDIVALSDHCLVFASFSLSLAEADFNFRSVLGLDFRQKREIKIEYKYRQKLENKFLLFQKSRLQFCKSLPLYAGFTNYGIYNYGYYRDYGADKLLLSPESIRESEYFPS